MKNNPPSKISNQQSLRVLIVEDSEDDVLLTIRELKKGGYNPVYERVETAAAMKKALRDKQWNIILCDYKLPKFNAPSAIALLKESNTGIPLIILSGAIGEDVAVECMRLGAHDYIMKSNLSRLCPAIARELEEANFRNKQKQAESQRDAAIESLRKSEKYFKEITENSSDIIIITDKNGEIKYCSRSVERFTGYTLEEIIGKSGFTFIHPDDLERAVNAFSIAILEKDTTLIPNSFRVIHKDGSVIYLDGFGKNLLDNPDVAGFVMNVRDVTEKKKIEEKLREEQQLFRAITDNSSDIILLMNPQGVNVFLNKAIENHLGYKPEERIHANGLEIVHPDDLKRITDAFITLATDTNSPVITGETRLRHKDGTWRTFETVGSNLVNNNIVEMIVIRHHNITERKKMEETLRQSEEKYRTILENMQEGYFEVDLTGNFTFFNDSLCRIDGYPRHELMGMNYRHYTDKETSKIVFQAFNKVYKTGNPLKEIDMQIIRKDGVYRYIEASVSLLKDSSGKPTGFRGIVHDITERKQMEEALRHEQQFSKSVLDNLPGIFYLYTYPENRLVLWNKQHETLLGFNAEDIKGRLVTEWFIPEYREAVLKAIEGVMENGQNSIEAPLLAKDGHQIPFFLPGVRFEANDQSYFMGVGIDITERKQAEEALRQSEHRYWEMSMIDALTQLYNSRHFYAQLKIETERSNRYEQPLTLLLLDLDKFKDFNDEYGHVEGDLVLSRLGQVIKRCLRETDSGYRYGGEEFTIMLPMTTSEEGIVIAKRIQTELRKEAFSPVSGQKIYMTVSIGLAQYKPKEEMKAFVQRVDHLMYKVKKNERGKICSDNGNLQ